MNDLKEGDIYKWYYKNDAEYRLKNSSTAYWCMDNRCVVRDVEFIKKWETEDYDKVYNLSHQKGCCPCFAIDKGAQVSNKALRTKYQGLVEKAESTKRGADDAEDSVYKIYRI